MTFKTCSIVLSKIDLFLRTIKGFPGNLFELYLAGIKTQILFFIIQKF